MKKILFSMAACFAMSAAAQQQARISGHLDGVLSDSLVIFVTAEDFHGFEREDTIAMQNGNFEYALPLSSVRVTRISALPCAKQPQSPGDIEVVMLPGQSCVLGGSLDDCKFSGDEYYRQWAEAYAVINPINKQGTALVEEIERRMAAGEDQDSLRVEMKVRQEALGRQMGKLALDFIKAHPDYDASVQMTTSLYGGYEEALALLTERVKTGPMAPMVNALTEMLRKMKAQQEAAKSIADGKMAPDFTLTDINGKPFTLSSLRGKFVVLDFWGSWCGWCIKGFPDMKKCYAHHRDKMEIVGIDCNDTEEKWRAAVEKHQLPWLHVFHAKNDNVLTQYAVSGFPTKVIINPDGTINKVVMGESQEFYTHIDSILK